MACGDADARLDNMNYDTFNLIWLHKQGSRAMASCCQEPGTAVPASAEHAMRALGGRAQQIAR